MARSEGSCIIGLVDDTAGGVGRHNYAQAVYRSNGACLEPKPADALWRYMDMTRFVALLETGALFFCRADRFDDRFEGSLSRLTVEQREAVGPPNPRRGVIDVPFKQLPPLTAINCWTASEHESAAMWPLYCPDGSGVAIRTTFAQLCDSFEPCKRWQIQISKVTYINYDCEAVPDTHLLAPFLHKRQSFEHEKEVRALIQRHPDPTLAETPTPFPDGGTHVEVSLDTLIEEIYVSPAAPAWYADLVGRLAQRYAVGAPVRQSNLTSGDPVF